MKEKLKYLAIALVVLYFLIASYGKIREGAVELIKDVTPSTSIFNQFINN